MIVELKENERIDDLQRNHYRIIQNKKRFCFGMDAVLLSGFATAQENERVLDLGTGTGIIPILMEAKTHAKELFGLEIQSEIVDMAKRSVQLNDLEHKIHIVEGDIKIASSLFQKSSFDVITSNPPYMEYHGGLKNPDLSKAVSRHEILCSLEDVIREATYLLKPGGHFYLVHRPFRLADIFETMRKYKLEPKRIKMVHPFIDKEANMVLIEAIRGGKPMMKIEAPIIVYRETGIYTDEIYSIYGY